MCSLSTFGTSNSLNNFISEENLFKGRSSIIIQCTTFSAILATSSSAQPSFRTAFLLLSIDSGASLANLWSDVFRWSRIEECRKFKQPEVNEFFLPCTKHNLQSIPLINIKYRKRRKDRASDKQKLDRESVYPTENWNIPASLPKLVLSFNLGLLHHSKLAC